MGYPHNIFLISPWKHMLWLLIRSAWQYFSYLSTKTCCGYSLEVPCQGTSNEYPQHMFSWRNKKNISIFGLRRKCSLSGAMFIAQDENFCYSKFLIFFFLFHCLDMTLMVDCAVKPQLNFLISKWNMVIEWNYLTEVFFFFSYANMLVIEWNYLTEVFFFQLCKHVFMES